MLTENRYPGDQVFPITVSADFGHDSTGRRYGPSFRSLIVAKNAARSGDTIVVYPGTYTLSDSQQLLKDGIRWHFHNGAIVTKQDSGSGVGYGIFDDRPDEMAAGCHITGEGIFDWRPAQQGVALKNTNCRGAVYIQDVQSTVSIKCKWIRGVNLDGGALVWIEECARFDLECARIYENWDQTVWFFTDNAVEFVPGRTAGIYWEKGECHTNVTAIDVTGYALYGLEPAGLTAETNWYHKGNLCNNVLLPGTHAPGDNCTYWVGLTAFWKVWIEVIEIRAELNAWHWFGLGKGYLLAQKISGDNCIDVSQNGAGELWIDVRQKMTATVKWIVTAAAWDGNLFVHCPHYEDGTGVTIGFDLAATAVIHLQGPSYAKVLNGKGILHTAGTTRATSLHIDTATTNGASNWPVDVAGAGLILKDCTFVGPAAATNCVRAAAAQNVVINGNPGIAVNRAKHANVTYTAGSEYQNAAVA